MLITYGFTCTNFFKQAVLADQVLWLAVVCSLRIFDLAVNKTSKVRTLTLVAQEERASMVCILLRLLKVYVTRSRKSVIIKDPLLFSSLQGKLFDFDF